MSIVNSEMAIDLNDLDKSNWKTYRFDEIAKNISERIDPNNTDLTVYIGLEHLDSGSIHIKRHGTPDDVNGQKLKFYKGDVIFGRRRAYQRKAGIATTDGFCSAHALVLRANPEVISPELFPFFLHSDLFMNRAVDISVGSLSPTINWGTLKHQEFIIPPLQLQGELSKLFKSMDNLSIKENALLEKAITFKKVKISNLLDEYSNKSSESVALSSLYSRKFKSINPQDYKEETVLHYSLPAFLENESPERVKASEIKSNKILISEDVVLFSKLNPNLPKIWTVEFDELVKKVGSTEWLPVIPNETFKICYLLAYLSSDYFINQVMRFVQGTSNSHKRVDPKKFYALKIPVLTAELRQEISEANASCIDVIEQIKLRKNKYKVVNGNIINKVF
ncbi:restriction endonuclease subunit S [Thalassotalea sp. G2M2-11]|uniref:restriction endonuclease subunit S n=1 Tax=Thalassotalea sp. G2M2-11 TaxID=2787627 RepID=UPI001F499432|nr:restriction endonuclease subunit S [Thalassotalea sp. G2M2-11]